MYKFILALLVVGVVSGCDNDGPAEQAGEKVDNAVEQMKDGGESLGDKMDKAATDMGNKIEDACEDMKEGVGAADTDC